MIDSFGKKDPSGCCMENYPIVGDKKRAGSPMFLKPFIKTGDEKESKAFQSLEETKAF